MTDSIPDSRQPPLSAASYDVGADPDSLAQMTRDFAALGDTYRVRMPSRPAPAWVIHDPDDVQRVLLSNHRNYTKGVGLDRVKILLGNGIMVSEGALWRRQRRMMQPLFHRRVIERFGQLIEAANAALLQRWERAAAQGGPVDVTEDTSQLALDVVLRALFGRDLEALADGPDGNAFEIVSRMPERNLQFAWQFRALGRRVRDLAERRAAGDEEHYDYLAMLMAARDKETGEPMGLRELVDEVLTLVVAGHETTAASLNMTWYLLSAHPEARERVEAEADALAGDAVLDYAGSEARVWTQAVLMEAMRLYPPGWLLTRRAIGPDTLGGCALAAGTDVLLSPYLVHRHPRHWDEPEAFRPQRFLDGAAAGRHKFAWFPFAVGPRHCIGENFAMYEMTIHLLRVARRFRLRCLAEGPPEMEAQVNLRTRANLLFEVQPR